MEKTVERAIQRYLKKNFPEDAKRIAARARELYPGLAAKAPDIGGKENILANNVGMFILFISYYEASDHRLGGKAIDEIIADLYSRFKFLGAFMNSNHTRTFGLLKRKLYKDYRGYAELVKEKQARGEWLDTWGMIVDPNNDPESFSFTLVGCPLVKYAREYGYMELMPHMCALDHAYAKIMHAKLIRTHTAATGADSCDYRYVPDKTETARNYTGITV
ncbi:MAG: L-2-amino-thiazoline-4-carboxylic acid hydrolase [Ruminiclostridium sp.]|nr:L-2-amino-thiazoline-4-carboxylic acid hydrolase [Ruminiclostridium sp.]